MYILIRSLGFVLPEAAGIDFRVISKFHRRGKQPFPHPIICGNGFRMSGVTSNAGYIAGVNERRFLREAARQIPDGGTVYNVGANTGYTALWLAQYKYKRSENVNVVAFEPDEENFRMLQDNIGLNGHLSVRAENAALGDTDGRVGFSSKGGGDGSAHVNLQSDAQVNVMRLDTFLACEADIKPPEVLVIDVEGYGGYCLDGARHTLKKYKPIVAIEIHSNTGAKSSGLFDDEESAVKEILTLCEYKNSDTLKSIWGTHQIWTCS